MSRTPSMSRIEAERMIGPADQLIVNSENRALLRKWATAIGYKSADAYALSNVQLANLYHEHGPRGTVQAAVSPTPVPVPDADPAPAAGEADDAAKALANLIRALAGGGAVLDAGKVAEIVAPMILDSERRMGEFVADALANNTVRQVLEIRTPDAVRVIEGASHALTPTVIQIASLGHDIMLVGPAGSGKTTIGHQVALALDLPFHITSTVFDTHELLGFVDGMGNYHSTAFRHAYQYGGVWVADEVDAWDAAALLAANSALANGYATFPDNETPVVRHPNFRVIATANTFGHGADRVYVGRNELDAASLDRFAVIAMDYDANLEFGYANGNTDWYHRVVDVRQQVLAKGIRHVVSSRAIIKGVQALSVGITQSMVEDIYLFKGMSKNDRAKIS